MINVEYLLAHPELIPSIPPTERLALETRAGIELVTRRIVAALKAGDLDTADGLIAERLQLAGRLEVIETILNAEQD